MKKPLLLILFALTMVTAKAQQQVTFTQYMFNGLSINPAYAGVHDALSATLLWREQWMGFEGAPSTQTLALHGPLGRTPLSAGMMAIRDKIGLTEQIGVYGSTAFRIYFRNKAKLSFGLQAGINNYSAEYIDTTNGLDPSLAEGNVSDFLVNFGFGLLYHSDKFYAGFSIPQIIEQNFDPTNSTAEAQLKRHYFFTSGIVVDLNSNFKLKPNVLFKYVEGVAPQVDLNLNLLIKEIIWAGVSYRSFDSIDLLAQIQITPKLQIGYAYDISTSNELRSVNSGSHEIMLNYVFRLTQSSAISPRYF
ncbi:PorP/SprF family type IX secretion system membrane protein [Reichenbachiella ulvae]|uniref:Type IX secretion system membrane protein PorP/SprF n=1 Tax=Reichenbachiella ulvae TaxID=2980104 RepID=A0ABT3CTU0_9BACT|nr:type IX secretion system membrane protein PorP/SprF [Reichenbachiella ulvae]MCV9386959.1 type IX secretion system membrane protein PorP/SprF [Reichenbachiella ulvae]